MNCTCGEVPHQIERVVCPRCKGQRSHPTIYETDTADERSEALEMAMCRLCGNTGTIEKPVVVEAEDPQISSEPPFLDVATNLVRWLMEQKYQGEEILHAGICCDFVSHVRFIEAVSMQLAASLSGESAPQPTSGMDLITAERERQVVFESWSPEHDDEHDRGELEDAAVSYINHQPDLLSHTGVPKEWPWAAEWWKPSKDRVRNLTKAGSLIAAEIDRLLRLHARSASTAQQSSVEPDREN